MLNLDQVLFTRKEANKVKTFNYNFELRQAERLAIMGPSGSGKSTLLDLIAGFEHPDSGKIYVNNEDVTNMPVDKRPLTLLSQNNNLFPHLPVFTNVALGLTVKAKLTSEQSDRTSKALEQVGIYEHANKLPTELSGGQQQRVALARTLLRAKPLLLLDEPFSALDADLRVEMAELVNNIVTQQNLTLITVTHDQNDAALLANKVVKMDDGILSF
ncbi:MAG: ATP-binding cassette domain-containing protein [Alphaproteobacteria bacterium]